MVRGAIGPRRRSLAPGRLVTEWEPKCRLAHITGVLTRAHRCAASAWLVGNPMLASAMNGRRRAVQRRSRIRCRVRKATLDSALDRQNLSQLGELPVNAPFCASAHAPSERIG